MRAVAPTSSSSRKTKSTGWGFFKCTVVALTLTPLVILVTTLYHGMSLLPTEPRHSNENIAEAIYTVNHNGLLEITTRSTTVDSTAIAEATFDAGLVVASGQSSPPKMARQAEPTQLKRYVGDDITRNRSTHWESKRQFIGSEPIDGIPKKKRANEEPQVKVSTKLFRSGAQVIGFLIAP
jgi:hypothetical protein